MKNASDDEYTEILGSMVANFSCVAIPTSVHRCRTIKILPTSFYNLRGTLQPPLIIEDGRDDGGRLRLAEKRKWNSIIYQAQPGASSSRFSRVARLG